MASVGPNNDGNNQAHEGAVGDMWLDAEADSTVDGYSTRIAGTLREGPHRRNRADTLDSSEDEQNGDENSRLRPSRPGLKTYEQLRSLHPERGNAYGGDEYSLEQRGGLMKSITTDIKSFSRKAARTSAQKVQLARERGCSTSLSWRKWVETLPFLITLRAYQKDWFAVDIAAGLAEGIMLIPMGMSYALLANVPAQYGLYTGVVPPLMYMLFGTCQQLSLGVSAIESLLVAEGVAKVIGWVGEEVNDTTTQADIDNKVKVTIAFTLCVGLWQVLMRVFGIGAIATLLSDPVLSGFSTGSAFLIGTSQLQHLFGVELPRDILPIVWADALTQVQKFNLTAIAIGGGGIVALWVFKKLNDRYLPKLPLPSQVVVVALATFFVYIFGLDGSPYDVKILGDIPVGLPPPAIPSFPNVDGIGGFSGYGGNIAIQSLIVAVMTYIITISIGKTFQRMNDNAYRINGSQELVAMSVANLTGSLFQAYPASGSLSRTAVVNSIGCKTRMHTVPAVVVVMIVLLAITPLLYTLPKAVLSSVVLFGVAKMVDFRDAKRLYHLNKPDFLLWNISFWVTALVGAIEGIVASVSVSLLYLLMQASRPANSILGRLPETREYRNIKRFPMAKEIPGIRIFRFDSSLHFANKDYFENRLNALENDPCEGVRIHTIVLDASSINTLDASAIDMLIMVAKSYEERGVSILCANWKGPQRDLLELSGFYDVIPPRNLFLGLHDAVVEARKRARDVSVGLPIPAASPQLATSAENNTSVDSAPSSMVPERGSVAETVVEIGPDGERREWRVGAVEITPSGQVEREWGLGRV